MLTLPKSIVQLLNKLAHWFKHKRDTWIKKRIPSKNSIQLNINNTFILPTRFGLSCMGIAICLFVLGTNFQNNIILLLCYFILAMLLLSIFHSYFFFIQHKITFLDIQPDYDNRRLSLPINIESTVRYKGGNLFLKLGKEEILQAVGASSTNIKIPLKQLKRGRYRCPSISLSATYGFGLFKCYSQLTPKLWVIVYPRVQKSALTLASAKDASFVAQGNHAESLRTDDLQGIREYVSTDSLKHVSWKHAAKGMGMLTKDFNDNKGVTGWLRIDDFVHLGVEQALRCLCFQIQQLNKEQVQFGLNLGTTKILPQKGDEHVKNCLLQLSLFESSKYNNNTYSQSSFKEDDR